MTEKEIIDKYIRKLITRPLDDASLLTRDLITSVDCVVSNLHFHNINLPKSIAKRAIRSSFSDIHAQGAIAKYYMTNLCLPPICNNISWLEKFTSSLLEENSQFNISCIGGNTCLNTKELSVAIVAFGKIASKRVTRYGACTGDHVYITGNVGDSLLGYKYGKQNPQLYSKYLVPEFRSDIGAVIGQFANASIDTSDGLNHSLKLLQECSNVKLEINFNSIPVSDNARNVISCNNLDISIAFGYSDDYQILFTSPFSEDHILAEYNLTVYKIGKVL